MTSEGGERLNKHGQEKTKDDERWGSGEFYKLEMRLERGRGNSGDKKKEDSIKMDGVGGGKRHLPPGS